MTLFFFTGSAFQNEEVLDVEAERNIKFQTPTQLTVRNLDMDD
jgi:hypothetical protein